MSRFSSENIMSHLDASLTVDAVDPAAVSLAYFSPIDFDRVEAAGNDDGVGEKVSSDD